MARRTHRRRHNLHSSVGCVSCLLFSVEVIITQDYKGNHNKHSPVSDTLCRQSLWVTITGWHSMYQRVFFFFFSCPGSREPRLGWIESVFTPSCTSTLPSNRDQCRRRVVKVVVKSDSRRSEPVARFGWPAAWSRTSCALPWTSLLHARPHRHGLNLYGFKAGLVVS